MNAAPNVETSAPVDEKFRQAAFAAAIAVKLAGPQANIAAIVAESGISQKVSPMAAASIAIAIQNIVLTAGTDTLMNDDVVASIASAAASSDPASVTPIAQVIATASASTSSGSFSLTKLNDTLAGTTDWVPLERIFEIAGSNDRPGFDAAIRKLEADGFLRSENQHLYVTESGRRFLDYSKYARK